MHPTEKPVSRRRNFHLSDEEREAYKTRIAAIPESDIAWFSGWLCADGSILHYGTAGTPRIRFGITDQDPLERMADMFGCNVSEPKRPSKHGFGVKDVYHWVITGEKAYIILQRCRPWLSKRYGERADAIFDNYTPRTHRGKKLSPGDVSIIKSELNNGIRGRALAAQYGVSEGMISAIKSGRTWGRIEKEETK